MSGPFWRQGARRYYAIPFLLIVLLALIAWAHGCARKRGEERAGRASPGAAESSGAAARPGAGRPAAAGGRASHAAGPLRIGYGWIEGDDRIIVDAQHLGKLHRGERLTIIAAGPVVRGARWERTAREDDDVRGFTPTGEGAAAGFARPAEAIPREIRHQYVAVLIAADSTAAGGEIYPLAHVPPVTLDRLLPRLFPGVEPARLKGSAIEIGPLVYGAWARREGAGDPATVTLVEIASDPDGAVRFRREEGPYGPRAPKCADVQAPTWIDCCESYLPQTLVAADLDGDGDTEVVQYDQCLEAVKFWVERPARGLERFAQASAYTLYE